MNFQTGVRMATTSIDDSAFKINQDGKASPQNTGTIVFGVEGAGRDYILPMARFTFYDNIGASLSGFPTIYIKMGPNFNSTLINNWQEASNIFGTPATSVGSLFGTDANPGIAQALGGSVVQSVQAQLLRGITGLTGALSSAALGGRTQIEFLTRRFLNNFQQLIYQGPTFRRFQLPFQLKPSTEKEALSMADIIHTFRVISSPNAGFGDEGNELNRGVRNPNGNTLETSSAVEGEEREAQNESVLNQFLDQLLTSVYDPNRDVLSFAYPDMCKFDLVLYSSQKEEIVTLFSSEMCVIETVAVDYGGGSKMQFFKPIDSGYYMPTDVSLSLSLRETKLITGGDVSNQYNNGYTIL
jgi:hypothetical protein